MPHGIKISGSGKAEDVPKGNWGARIDWSFLEKPVSTLGKGEYLKIEVKKAYKVTLIRKYIKKRFKHWKLSVRQRRQNANLLHIYIVREES